ncbi:MAG: hypothetical protein WCW52_09255 [Elusimicrobiales bacterium]|jgi:hypothetical protein
MNDWVKEASIAVTVCDRNGMIKEMNDKSGKTFENRGGLDLIGSNLLECHPEPSKTKLKKMLADPAPRPNAYTIEKNGVKKLIYQFASRKNGGSDGLVELSLELPPDMPHFVRK